MIEVLAHQGGWDEAVMFGVPIVLAIIAVKIAEKRGNAKRRKETAPDLTDESTQ